MSDGFPSDPSLTLPPRTDTYESRMNLPDLLAGRLAGVELTQPEFARYSRHVIMPACSNPVPDLHPAC